MSLGLQGHRTVRGSWVPRVTVLLQNGTQDHESLWAPSSLPAPAPRCLSSPPQSIITQGLAGKGPMAPSRSCASTGSQHP